MCLDCGVTNLDICSGSAHPSSRLHQLAGVAMSKPGLFVPVSFNCSVSECFLTNPHACSHLCNQSVQGIYFAAQKAATLSGPSPKTFSLERDLPGFCHVHVARTLWLVLLAYSSALAHLHHESWGDSSAAHHGGSENRLGLVLHLNQLYLKIWITVMLNAV